MSNNESASGAPSSTRAPYATPLLKVYGSLGDLTTIVGMMSTADGGGGMTNRSAV